MKKYGDAVTYIRNGVKLAALVIQSNPTIKGEELVLSYLDPAAGAGVIRDMSKVVARTFAVPPYKDGNAQGWQESDGAEAGLMAALKSGEQMIFNQKDRITDLEKTVDDLGAQLAQSGADLAESEHQLAKKSDTVNELVIAAQTSK